MGQCIVSAAGSSDLPHSGPGFSAIVPVTAVEVLKLLHSALPKSSRMDTVPTSLLLAVSETFSEIIAYLANLSFSEGRFLTKFKSASVTPLLKSDHLDKTAPASYRPISNLNFISKILERLFPQRFQPHIPIPIPTTILTCAQKRTSSQLSLPHGTVN